MPSEESRYGKNKVTKIKRSKYFNIQHGHPVWKQILLYMYLNVLLINIYAYCLRLTDFKATLICIPRAMGPLESMYHAASEEEKRRIVREYFKRK